VGSCGRPLDCVEQQLFKLQIIKTHHHDGRGLQPTRWNTQSCPT
jgi:hypothetical protein